MTEEGLNGKANLKIKELKELKDHTKTVSITFQCPSWIEDEITSLSDKLDTKRSETIRLILESYLKEIASE